MLKGCLFHLRSFYSSATQRLTYSSYIRQEEDVADAEANARICHTTHREPCEQSLAGHAGLLCALTLHSLLEGLAIGVQDTAGKVNITSFVCTDVN